MRKYFAPLLFCLASVVAQGQSTTSGRQAETLLKSTTQIFKELSRGSLTTVPDGVLNRTQCVVVVPSATRGTHSGLVSCRESDQWNSPFMVSFQQKKATTGSRDLLIFVLKDAATHALRSGSLNVETYKRPLPPLAPKAAIPPEHDLDVELLTYQYAANRLSGCRVQGMLHGADHSSDADLADTHKKATKQYLSSLTSFFNTIIPTGIVIHHTAVLPEDNAPPRNEHEVDKYHATRGFEITCLGRTYHVAYHYLILPNGRVQRGRPERCEGAHAKGHNSYLGISVVGDFDDHDNPAGAKGPTTPTKKQMASLVQLCRRLMQEYHIPVSHIIRHSDITATQCPGDRFPFRSFLQQLKNSARS